MLHITIPGAEIFNEETNEFISTKEYSLDLEHSLVSISKWESKWEKAYLGRAEKNEEELLDYIKCMTITKNVPDDVYIRLTRENLNDIVAYINKPMTATTFADKPSKPNREVVTSELIYYWMIAYNIPDRYERWHLNRLLTLVKVCSLKNEDPKKMSKGAVARQNAELNAARRKAMHSKG